MSDLHGYTGRILDVDLSRGEASTIDTSQYVPRFIGGLGVAAKIAWDELTPGADALSPDNILFLMVGPLTGTMASGGGRVVVAGIAPQQRPSVFSRSGMGGHWGAELKYAGFDGVVVRGRAEKPVYLWVHDGEAEIRDAAHLWGTGTYNTTTMLRTEHGPKTRIVSCGQAGERLARIACVQTETGNAAGQGGFGAVMGSKNLKAVAVRGTLGVRVAHSQRLLDLCLKASREGQSPAVPGGGFWRRHQEPGILSRARKCGFCITPCQDRLFMGVPGESAPGLYNAAFQCWGYSTSMRAQVEARSMTADWGLNGWEISYGIIPWLQRCRQHGLIDAIDGLEIPIPDKPVINLSDAAPVPGAFLHMLIRKIATREGEIGDALADGACYAAERLFGDEGAKLLDDIYPRRFGQTNHWNGHWGTGGSPYFPFWLVPVLQWCIDSRDPASDATHQFTEHVLRYFPEHGPNRGPLTWEEARAVCESVYGTPDVCDPTPTYDRPEARALPAIFHHDRAMVVESLVLCDREQTRVFSMQSEDKKADTALMAKLYSAVTGHETSEAELDQGGARVFNLLRAIDIRNHGRSRVIDWATAKSLTQPAFTDQVALDLEQFSGMLDKYYLLRGWDPVTGYPTRAKLEQLDLPDVADALEALV